MAKSQIQNFNHLKIHSQFSICEGAIKIDDLKEISKEKKIRSLAICDTSNLCGALEFAEKISKVGTQPIIGTQINFKLDDTIGLLPLFALNEIGYKRIIELSSLSYLNNDGTSDPHLNFEELLKSNSKCIYVTETIGHGSNLVTGDYSVGATGFLVEDGEFKYPVSEITIAGNFKDMFKNIFLANDLDFEYSTNSPTMMIEGMTVAGK